MIPTAILRDVGCHPNTTPTRDGRVRVVADVMLTDVKRSGVDTTVRELRVLFENAHVHMAVIVDGDVLLGVVDRADVLPEHHDEMLARHLGGDGPSGVVGPDTALTDAWETLLTSGRRRLAVVGPDGTLLGLLCLKHGRQGFCSDRDIHARRVESGRTEATG